MRTWALVMAVTALGCQGDIDGPRGGFLDPGLNPGGAGSGAAAAVDAAGADAEMRAANPTLFEIALRYFPSEVPASGKTRLFRLTRAQLDLTTRTLLPAHAAGSAQEALPADPLQTNYEFADNLSFNAANFTPYVSWVDAVAASVRADPTLVVNCTSTNNAPACLAEQARTFTARAFRGAASDAQLTRFTDFFVASVSSVGLPDATADLVALALTSPSYVFRDEVRTDAASALLPAQRLQNISYTLADAPPEALGLSFATADAQVGTPGAYSATVDQVLATAEARQKLLRFFLSWLEVKEQDEFTIDSGAFPEFTPAVAAAAIEETRAFLDHQLAGAAPRLGAITQSTESFVSEAVAFLYGLSAPAGGGLVQLDPTQRLGIFTQPAVIASHSGPTTTRLVKRGVFFTRKVMCLPLGSPPEDVDLTVPMTPNATERQRIEGVTASPRCQGCHAFINPFGFMQENYDPIGRWRTTDEGLPINASIMVNFLDEGLLTTASPVEALRGFTSSLRFQQCFARQLFRFYMGREEGPGDDPLLRRMFFGFADGGEQDIIGMLRELAGSAEFSQRTEAP